MPHTWKQARDAYCYPVDLRKFTGASKYRGWFKENIKPGDRCRTMAFQDRFRKYGPDNLEAWGEVVFWKNYKRRAAANRITKKNVFAREISAIDLWSKCNDYIKNTDLESFRAFRELLFETPVVATAATFPAFICPEKFPMVDKQIARWAMKHGAEHSYPGGPALTCVPDLSSGEVLRESHWPFVESWIRWCRFTACKLEILTGETWRARDVEMAVYTAQTAQKKDDMQLNPLVSTW